MAAASSEGTAGTRLLPAGTALALLGGLVYLGTLCAACKRKGRKKVAPDGVKLVEEALLCQTQLRSLSKSDTKLHELYRVKVRDVQRPASLDLPGAAAPGGESLHSSGLLHRELPQIPVPEPPATSPAPDQTYSNLLFTPLRKPAPDAVYECLAVGEEGTPVPPSVTPVPPMPAGTQLSPPRAGHGAADYACVHKVKKVVSVEGQDGAVAGASGAQHGWDGTGSACHAKLEEMYSTVCKATKKKSQVPGSTPRAVKDGVDPPSGGPGGSGGPPPYHQEGAPAAPGPPDPCYESINDRAWTAQARGPEPDYEAVDIHWKKAAKGAKPGKGCVPENLYESVVDVWAGGSQKGSARTAANGLQVYITNL